MRKKVVVRPYMLRLRIGFSLMLWGLKFILFKPTERKRHTLHDFFDEYSWCSGLMEVGDMSCDELDETYLNDALNDPKDLPNFLKITNMNDKAGPG